MSEPPPPEPRLHGYGARRDADAASAASGGRGRWGRKTLFFAICVLCVAGAGAYTLAAALRGQGGLSGQAPASAADLDTVAATPHLVFIDNATHHVALVPLAASDGPRYLTPLQCQRVYFAAGQGLCLSNASIDVLGNGTYSFDSDFNVSHTYPQVGLPSRVRLAPNGEIGSTTVFVAGDSYNTTGFSTRTMLIDTPDGEVLNDLEDFSTYFGNLPFQSVDFNFWGVTFASDSDQFYATLGSGGKTYLVHGDMAAGRMDVLRENAECPSISPDNTRLVFKDRTNDNPLTWRLAVLDLASMSESWVPGESRSVDDQVEWLDDNHILYAVPGTDANTSDVWEATLDGSAPPEVFVKGASSPAVVRAGT